MATTLLDMLGPYGAYVSGRESQVNEYSKNASSMMQLGQLAQLQQKFNNDNIMMPVRNSQERATLEQQMQENEVRNYQAGVRNKLGLDHAVAGEKLKLNTQRAEHYSNMAKWAAGVAELADQVPPENRKQWLANIAKQSGFDEIINESYWNANPNNIPNNLKNIAKTAYQHSMQGQDTAAKESGANTRARISDATARRGQDIQSSIADRRINSSERIAGMQISADAARQKIQHGHELTMLDERAIVDETKAQAEHLRQQGIMGYDHMLKGLRLDHQAEINKELQAGRISAESLARIEDAQTKLELMGVDHANRLALASTEHQYRMELETTKATAKGALDKKDYDLFTKWVDTNMAEFDELAKSRGVVPTPLEKLQYQNQVIMNYANYMRTKPEGEQPDLGEMAGITTRDRNPKLELPSNITINGKQYSREQVKATQESLNPGASPDEIEKLTDEYMQRYVESQKGK